MVLVRYIYEEVYIGITKIKIVIKRNKNKGEIYASNLRLHVGDGRGKDNPRRILSR